MYALMDTKKVLAIILAFIGTFDIVMSIVYCVRRLKEQRESKAMTVMSILTAASISSICMVFLKVYEQEPEWIYYTCCLGYIIIFGARCERLENILNVEYWKEYFEKVDYVTDDELLEAEEEENRACAEIDEVVIAASAEDYNFEDDTTNN